jgi:hypothetical protein
MDAYSRLFLLYAGHCSHHGDHVMIIPIRSQPQVGLRLPPEVKRAAERRAADQRRSLALQCQMDVITCLIADGYLTPQRPELQAAL